MPTLYCVRSGDGEHVVDTKIVRETPEFYYFGESPRNQLGILHSPLYAHRERARKRDLLNTPGIGLSQAEAVKSHVESERRFLESRREELGEAEDSLGEALRLAERLGIEVDDGSEIDKLKLWFAKRLSAPLPFITEQQRSKGLDALPWAHKLRDEAASAWLEEHEYELSYNQSCVAFFAAYDEAAT